MAVVTPVRIRDWTYFVIWSEASRTFFICATIIEDLLSARLAQLVERQPFKLVVVGSSPTVGALLLAEIRIGLILFRAG